MKLRLVSVVLCKLCTVKFLGFCDSDVCALPSTTCNGTCAVALHMIVMPKVFDGEVTCMVEVIEASICHCSPVAAEE